MSHADIIDAVVTASEYTPQAEVIRLARERYRVDDRGVWRILPRDKEGQQPPDFWVCAPLHITAATRDSDGDNHGHLLEFKDRHNKPQRWAMPLELLEDQAQYRRVLRRMGLAMNGSADGRKYLQEYLDVCHSDQRALCVDRVGWHGAAYVLPDETIGKSAGERVFLQSMDHRSEGYRTAGTLAGWRAEVAAFCAGNSRLLLAVSTAFAAPLLALANEEGGGLHLIGDSSAGKTTALRVACSVWGEPERLERWRATGNGLEGVALAHNDNLLALDELKEVDPREAGQIAYMLANGAGKRRARADGCAKPRHRWRLLYLSTGELSLEQHVKEVGQRTYAGQEVRLVELPADAGSGLGLFEHLHTAASGKALADKLLSAAAIHYGHAGRELLRIVSEQREAIANDVNVLRESFIKAYLPKDASSQVQRVASRFGLIAAAGEIANREGLTDWEGGDASEGVGRCFQDWINHRGGVGSAEERRALEQVRLFFEQHGEARFAPWPGQEDICSRCQGSGLVDFTDYKQGKCLQCNGTGTISSEQRRLPVINRAGFRRITEDERTEYFVLPQVFKAEIAKGHNATWLAKLLIDRGLLLADADGKPQRRERLPGLGQNRVYRFTPDIMGQRTDAP